MQSTMRLVMGLAVLGCVLVFSAIARAAPPTGAAEVTKSSGSSPSVTTQEPEYDDYRLSLVASDAAALSLVILGAVVADGNETIATLGLVGGAATYALGGPILHVAHEQSGRALASFGLRVGLPGTGILLFAAMATTCQDEGEAEGYCVLAAAVFGGTLMIGGVVTAMIVDDGFLGRAPKAQPKNDTRASSFRAGLSPLIDPKKKTLGLSLVGAF